MSQSLSLKVCEKFPSGPVLFREGGRWRRAYKQQNGGGGWLENKPVFLKN